MEARNIEHTFEMLSENLLPQICMLVECTRSVPIIWTHEISSAEGEHIGYVEVVKDEEPVDAVDRFARRHSLSGNELYNLLNFVCEQISCSRDRPVVFRKDVTDENGNNVGAVEILEEEEVIDAVVRFIRDTSIDLDEIAFKNHFFEHACDNPRVKCTRNISHVFDNRITDKDGVFLGQLVITEHEEPADKVFQFCEETKLKEHDYQNILDQVCSADFVLCKRRMPIVASIPLNDPDGQLLGKFEVELKEEPVDALYRFFAIHGLFQKDWDFQRVLNQVCNLPKMVCGRKRAVKFHAESISMGGFEIGPLTIWDQEEVVDKLFNIRMELNLTETDQMTTFGLICTKREVYCKRTQAKIYELTGITKKDYEKFGNETCQRKYAGWQFLESFVSSSLGSKARDFIVLESVEKVGQSSEILIEYFDYKQTSENNILCHFCTIL